MFAAGVKHQSTCLLYVRVQPFAIGMFCEFEPALYMIATGQKYQIRIYYSDCTIKGCLYNVKLQLKDLNCGVKKQPDNLKFCCHNTMEAKQSVLDCFVVPPPAGEGGSCYFEQPMQGGEIAFYDHGQSGLDLSEKQQCEARKPDVRASIKSGSTPPRVLAESMGLLGHAPTGSYKMNP